MSELVIYQIQKTGDVIEHTSITHKAQGASMIWLQLSNTYHFAIDMFGPYQTWNAFCKDVYTPEEDIVLGTTFDKVIVLKENIPTVINAMIKYDKYHSCTILNQQVEILQELLENEETVGIAWKQTNISDSLWESNAEVAYNIYKRKEHWNLFDDLDESKVDYSNL